MEERQCGMNSFSMFLANVLSVLLSGTVGEK